MARKRPFHSSGLLALGALLVLPSLAHAGGYSHTRDGWAYGLNVGWGWAQAEAKDTSTQSSLQSDWIDDLTGGLRIAFAPDDDLMYGLEFSGWAEPAAGLDETVFWILAQVHWFPGGQGFFLHGGAGLGALNLSYEGPPVAVSQTNGGFAWGVGAGYEVRVTPTFALGLSYDYRSVNVGAISYFDDVETTIHGATIAATWYTD